MALALLAVSALSTSCISAEETFVGSRLEDLCADLTPICSVQASCVLAEDRYLRSSFPGGLRVIVETIEPDRKLVVRLFLTEMVFPGTELLVQAWSPKCKAFDDVHLLDVDLFDLAGDTRIIQLELDAPDEGEHLVELFSDMSATYLMTVDVETP